MARNSEKTASMLYRFRAAQAAEMGIVDIGQTRRPTRPDSIDDIPTCERWRGQVIKDISFKVTKIQDESLSDYQIRDLNDEINKLMNEKYRWEKRIRSLGGPNYMRSTGTGAIVNADGREVIAPATARGYRYFGRAKDLPGVKELFEAAARAATKDADSTGAGTQPNRAELRKNVDASYYGYNLDEEDGTLVEYEAKREREAVESLLVKAAMAKKGSKSRKDEDKGGDGGENGTDTAADGWEEIPGDCGDGNGWNLPTLDEVQAELVERRKRKLLEALGAA